MRATLCVIVMVLMCCGTSIAKKSAAEKTIRRNVQRFMQLYRTQKFDEIQDLHFDDVVMFTAGTCSSNVGGPDGPSTIFQQVFQNGVVKVDMDPDVEMAVDELGNGWVWTHGAWDGFAADGTKVVDWKVATLWKDDGGDYLVYRITFSECPDA